MSCVPCQKARTAMARAVHTAAIGNVRAAVAQMPQLVDALGEKAEAVRVRARLMLRHTSAKLRKP